MVRVQVLAVRAALVLVLSAFVCIVHGGGVGGAADVSVSRTTADVDGDNSR